jgi:hypothetical protein
LTPSARFAAFVRRADDLVATRLAKAGFHVGLTLTGSALQPATMTPRFPDEEELRSYLTVFRPFILEGDPVFLGRVFNVAERALTSDLHRNALRSARKAYKVAIATTGIGLHHNSRDLSPEETLDLFLNGHYFHTDEEKARLLAGIPTFAMPLVKLNFLNSVIGVSEVILYTSGALKDAGAKGHVNDASG